MLWLKTFVSRPKSLLIPKFFSSFKFFLGLLIGAECLLLQKRPSPEPASINLNLFSLPGTSVGLHLRNLFQAPAEIFWTPKKLGPKPNPPLINRAKGAHRSVRYVRVDGRIQGDLQRSLRKYGVPLSVAQAYTKVFSHMWQNKDKFSLLYQESLKTQGKTFLYGILGTKGKQNVAYHFSPKQGSIKGFYDEKGRALAQKRASQKVAYRSFAKPVPGPISSYYGFRSDPFSRRTKMHRGLDFAAPSGTPIKVVEDGVVEKSYYSPSYGLHVIVRHHGSLKTSYAHLSRTATYLQPGYSLKKGDVLGYVGRSGRATGPHLHFEVTLNERRVNPLQYFASPKVAALPKPTLPPLRADLRKKFLTHIQAVNKIYRQAHQQPFSLEVPEKSLIA